MASPVQSVPQCSPTQPTAFADTATTTTNNNNFTTVTNFPLLENSASLLLPQEQRPNAFSQVNIFFLTFTVLKLKTHFS